MKMHAGEELDVKPYEADMRHLLNTYVLAEPAETIGALGNMSLMELIIVTGIHDAIARQLNEKGKLSRNAIAEAIINNVRKTIIREQLTDPLFYEQMSKLLDDLIKQKRDDVAAYEEFLKNAEELARKISAKHSVADVPLALQGKKAATVIYNNLPRIYEVNTHPVGQVAEQHVEYGDERLQLALNIDRIMKEEALAGWRGDQPKESKVLTALHKLLGGSKEVTLAVFDLVKNQPEY
jgi:type I restriction enzyme R subunit